MSIQQLPCDFTKDVLKSPSVLSQGAASITPRPRIPSSGLFVSWIVMAKTMIGSGLLSLAYVTSKCGWILGLAMLLLIGALTFFTLHLLNCLCCSLQSDDISMYSIAKKHFPPVRWVQDFAVSIKCTGAAISYIQAVAALLTDLIETWIPPIDDHLHKTTLRALIIAGSLLSVAPWSYFKRATSTFFINCVGLFSMLYLLGLSSVLNEPGLHGTTSIWPTANTWEVLSVLPIYVFAFACHQNLPLVLEDMKNRSVCKSDIVNLLAETSAFLFFLPLLILPYLTFGETVSDVFINDFDSQNIYVQVGKFILILFLLSGFPLQLIPARKSVIIILRKGKPQVRGKKELKLRIIVTTIILAIVFVVSLVVQSLGYTFAFIGILGGFTISFIVPTLLYCVAYVDNKSIRWFLSAALLVLSLISTPVFLAALLVTIASKK